MVANDLYDHPDLFDALLPIDAHVPFYLDLARQQGGAVLDLACGSGQLTIPIASDGLETVGLDRSRAMLNAARRRASDAGVSVALVQGDMCRFALRRHFNLIVVARNSLLHLLSTEDLVAAFAAARHHLAPGGILAFDIFNPDAVRLARPPGQRFPVMEVSTAAFGPLRVEETHEYDGLTQVNRASWYISTREKQDAWIVPIDLRSIFPEELPLILSAAGLELIARYGDLVGTRFGPWSRSQVCLCRAAGM